jgi:hypothetical protein
MYRDHPILVDRSGGEGKRVWPVKYTRMFDMTNDSSLFKTRAELETEGFMSAALNRWRKGDAEAMPLYVGRMIRQFDHRHANVTVNEENLHNAAFGATLSAEEKSDPGVYPLPQYWVTRDALPAEQWREWVVGFRDIARATDVRTMIAAVLPCAGFGNKVPLLIPQGLSGKEAANQMALLLANLNCFAFDFILRQKLQSTTINLYILEQLPVIAPSAFEVKIGAVRIADFIREQVLRLSYTAHDLAPFARDLGFEGEPFGWDEEDRRARMAALDALFMRLYGLSTEDAEYVLESFPIVRGQDEAACGGYRTQERILAGMERLAAGQLPATGIA